MSSIHYRIVVLCPSLNSNHHFLIDRFWNDRIKFTIKSIIMGGFYFCKFFFILPSYYIWRFPFHLNKKKTHHMIWYTNQFLVTSSSIQFMISPKKNVHKNILEYLFIWHESRQINCLQCTFYQYYSFSVLLMSQYWVK